MVTLVDVEAAATRLEGSIERTPVAHSATLSAITGAEVFLKFENLQFTASFKERGAGNAITLLDPAVRARGLIAVSAGNHAQGVARQGQRLGAPVTVVMPRFTPFSKVQATTTLGARVVLHGADLGEAAAHAEVVAADEGLTLIHPFDDPHVVAGQGTVALELLADAPDLDVVVVPVGGGGLLAGMAVVYAALAPQVELLGVESATFPSMQAALGRGPVPTPGQSTIAEGIAVPRTGGVPAAICQALGTDFVSVDEGAIEDALLLLLEVEKTVAEGAAAAGLAAVLADPERFRGRRVGLVITGGNVDMRLLATIIGRGLVRSGRLSRLRVQVADVPGALASLTAVLASAGANIVELSHQRQFTATPARQVDVEVVVETRDRDHRDAVVAALSAAGMVVAEG